MNIKRMQIGYLMATFQIGAKAAFCERSPVQLMASNK